MRFAVWIAESSFDGKHEPKAEWRDVGHRPVPVIGGLMPCTLALDHHGAIGANRRRIDPGFANERPLAASTCRATTVASKRAHLGTHHAVVRCCVSTVERGNVGQRPSVHRTETPTRRIEQQARFRTIMDAAYAPAT